MSTVDSKMIFDKCSADLRRISADYVAECVTSYIEHVDKTIDFSIPDNKQKLENAIRYHIVYGGFAKEADDTLTAKGLTDMFSKLDGIDFSGDVEIKELDVGTRLDSMQTSASRISGVVRQGQYFAMYEPLAIEETSTGHEALAAAGYIHATDEMKKRYKVYLLQNNIQPNAYLWFQDLIAKKDPRVHSVGIHSKNRRISSKNRRINSKTIQDFFDRELLARGCLTFEQFSKRELAKDIVSAESYLKLQAYERAFSKEADRRGIADVTPRGEDIAKLTQDNLSFDQIFDLILTTKMLDHARLEAATSVDGLHSYPDDNYLKLKSITCFTVEQPLLALISTAKKVADTWSQWSVEHSGKSHRGHAQDTSGGGQQVYVGIQSRECIKSDLEISVENIIAQSETTALSEAEYQHLFDYCSLIHSKVTFAYTPKEYFDVANTLLDRISQRISKDCSDTKELVNGLLDHIRSEINKRKEPTVLRLIDSIESTESTESVGSVESGSDVDGSSDLSPTLSVASLDSGTSFVEASPGASTTVSDASVATSVRRRISFSAVAKAVVADVKSQSQSTLTGCDEKEVRTQLRHFQGIVDRADQLATLLGKARFPEYITSTLAKLSLLEEKCLRPDVVQRIESLKKDIGKLVESKDVYTPVLREDEPPRRRTGSVYRG